MNLVDLVWRAVLIGVGATVVMDLWAIIQKRVFRISGLDYALLGRWIGHFAHGQFKHDNIAVARPIRGERVLGWTAHYLIGVTFAVLLLAIWGESWARRPALGPALIVGWATLAAPFLLLQPGMGFGVAASKTRNPNAARLRSIVTHTVYGLGLYAAGWWWAALLDR